MSMHVFLAEIAEAHNKVLNLLASPVGTSAAPCQPPVSAAIEAEHVLRFALKRRFAFGAAEQGVMSLQKSATVFGENAL